MRKTLSIDQGAKVHVICDQDPMLVPGDLENPPMIVIDPIPGQEEWNADYVAGTGAGLQLRQPESVPPAVRSLLIAPERLVMMREQAARAGRPRAAQTIAERILADLRAGVYA